MRNENKLEDVSIAASQSLQEKEYWMRKLSGEIRKTVIPYDYKSDFAKEIRLDIEGFAIKKELYARLMKLSNKSYARLHMILLAAVCVLLNQYSGSKDIIVGTTIARQKEEEEFINTILPLRTTLTDRITFKELLLQVKETVYGASAHQNYPLESLLNNLNMKSTGNEFPLFDIVVLLDNIHDKRYLRGIPVNLLFCFNETGAGIKGYIEYNADLYEKGSAERIIDYLERIMQTILTDIDICLSAVDLLSHEEKINILSHFNDTSAAYPEEKSIHELFELQVRRAPGNIAVVCKDYGAGGMRHGPGEHANTSINCAELNKKANQLARLLRVKGVKPGIIVGLMLERSIEMVIGILAVLKAGGAYLPIDTGLPESRILFMLKDSNVEHILTAENIPVVQELETEVIFLPEPGIFSGPDANLGKTSRPQDPAYMIYTSGTTGNPKGVLVPHKGLVNYVCWAAAQYVKNQRVSFPLYTSISFDLTITSIFVPLITGNIIVVYGSDTDEFLVERVVNDNRVDVVKLTPSHLRLILYRHDIGEKSNIKGFVVGGEEFDTRIAAEITAVYRGNIVLYNEYGPTEAVVGCMIYKYDPLTDKGRSVPIGRPVDNMQIYLLNAYGRPVPLGALGELYIAGVGLAHGYLNQPEFTASKFVQALPVDLRVSPATLYRTGDLARWLPQGGLEFMGRRDEQVSIRGFRVELAEIEAHLLRHEQIKDAVVVVRNDAAGDTHIWAYVVAAGENEAGADLSDLKKFLLRDLPLYMIPAYFVYLDEIPLTTNGKLDKRALPASIEDIETGVEYVPPRDRIEEQLVEIWQQELKVKRIGIKDNFFNIGGDSIKSISLLGKINEEFNSDFKIVNLYQNATIEKFARLFAGSETESREEYNETVDELEKIKNEFLGGI